MVRQRSNNQQMFELSGQPGARGGHAGENKLGRCCGRQRFNSQRLLCRCPDAASHAWWPCGCAGALRDGRLGCFAVLMKGNRCEALHISAAFTWPIQPSAPVQLLGSR